MQIPQINLLGANQSDVEEDQRLFNHKHLKKNIYRYTQSRALFSNLWVATIFGLARTHIRTLDFRPHAHRTHVCVLPKFESHTHTHVCVFACAFCQISHTHTHIFPKWKWFFDAIIFFADDSKIILGYSFWSEFQFTGQLDFVFNFSKVK